MFETLSGLEKDMMFLIIKSNNYKSIIECLNINYSEYLIIKRSLLKKLHAEKITQILAIALIKGLNINNL